MSQVAAKYTLFTTSGVPIRAVCQVTMEEISGETPGQNPTSGALAARRVHRVGSGDSLASLAHREYGDAGAWRIIAEANGIDDPLRLAPGTQLLLPALDELTRLKGSGGGTTGPGRGASTSAGAGTGMGMGTATSTGTGIGRGRG
nr:LysM domain-containing protein [Streptomyces nanshensis]